MSGWKGFLCQIGGALVGRAICDWGGPNLKLNQSGVDPLLRAHLIKPLKPLRIRLGNGSPASSGSSGGCRSPRRSRRATSARDRTRRPDLGAVDPAQFTLEGGPDGLDGRVVVERPRPSICPCSGPDGRSHAGTPLDTAIGDPTGTPFRGLSSTIGCACKRVNTSPVSPRVSVEVTLCSEPIVSLWPKLPVITVLVPSRA